mmetsp:Transcript_7046/g.17687  ORF Transcript_7046/g.17687 Transcript_7046/m.17687 type:complete len:102 (+) Transcript_7046:244-549(+)
MDLNTRVPNANANANVPATIAASNPEPLSESNRRFGNSGPKTRWRWKKRHDTVMLSSGITTMSSTTEQLVVDLVEQHYSHGDKRSSVQARNAKSQNRTKKD